MPGAESGRHDAQMLTSAKATALSTPTSTSPFIPYDTAFGIGGRVADYAPSFLYRLDLNQFGDSAVLLAGYRRHDPQAPLQLALARYHADGRPDTSFGDDGIAVVSGSPTVATLPNVRTTVQPDGKIVVATVFQLASQEQRWAMSRLTAAGQLDPTFSGDGKLQISFPDAPRGLHLAAVLVRADGTILVVGSQGSRLCAARYRLNGSLDLSFGVDGKLVTGLPGDRATVLSAALDAVGNVVVVGSTTMPDSGADMVVGRLHLTELRTRTSGLPVSSSRTSASAPTSARGWLFRPTIGSWWPERPTCRRLDPNPLCCDCCPTVHWTPASVSTGACDCHWERSPTGRKSPRSGFFLAVESPSRAATRSPIPIARPTRCIGCRNRS